MALFKRLDGEPMQFYLAELSEETFKKYKNLIESNGGKIENHPHETVLIFTFPSTSYNYRFVFDVQFIDDCVKFKEFLNINQYFIGDSRLTPKCNNVLQLTMGIAKNCLRCINGRKNLKDGATNRKKNFSVEEVQESSLKPNPSPSKSKDLTLKENEPFVSKPQRKPAISENSSLDSDTTILLSQTESSDSDYQASSSNIPETESLKSSSTVSEHDSSELEDEPVAKRITRSSKSIVLSDELLNWVEEVNNKTLKKDVFGHPIGEHINFQRWEQRRMIDFIIKSGNICNAGLMSTWECAENLKILPKHRTKRAMQSNMILVVLPKIEEFRLRPEVLSEFVNLRSDLALAKERRDHR